MIDADGELEQTSKGIFHRSRLMLNVKLGERGEGGAIKRSKSLGSRVGQYSSSVTIQRAAWRCHNAAYTNKRGRLIEIASTREEERSKKS